MGYRLDIQLLRALAVILVVLFHLEVPFFGKGFLGVDIFFVISGFLMAVLYKDGQPVEFLKRRVRRLFPPYVAVLLVTIAAGSFILLPNELYQLNEQSVYAAFFTSNIGFWNENSYFDSSGFKPLLHLWTLGVEAQYYLFVPLIMWFFRKHSLSTIVLALGSFVLCALALYVSPKTSFFMMPLRAWEFLIGAMAGLYFTNKGAVKYTSYRLLGVIGLTSLIGVQFLPVDGNKLGFLIGHPGLASLLTCIATLLVIVYGLPTKFLDNKIASVFIYIGTISYSIYLVHFPVITFYFYKPFEGTQLSSGNIFDTLILGVIIALLSLALYYFIEKPGPKFKQSALAGMLAVFVTGFVLGSDFFINKRFTDYELGFLMANQDRAPYRCGKLARITDPTAKVCLLGGTLAHEKSILLVGNSHADSIKISFDKVANLYKYNTYFMVGNNPLHGGVEPDQLVSEAISKGVKVIAVHHKAQSVRPEVYMDLYELAVEEGIKLVVIGPVPVYQEHIPKYINDNYKKDGKIDKLQSIDQHFDNVTVDLEIFKGIQNEEVESFSYYEPANYLCNDSCNFMSKDGRAWYFDRHHLTLTGAEQLEPLFKDLFSDLVNAPN